MAASIFHFGEIRIPEARAELLRAGVPVRPEAGVAAAILGAGRRHGDEPYAPGNLAFDASGLVPVVVQDRASGDVLMVAWANARRWPGPPRPASRTSGAAAAGRSGARARPRDTGCASSRLRADCDRDTLLLVVEPEGPACHTGARSCFGEPSPTAAGMLEELARVVAERAKATPETSYTARLLAKGPRHQVLKKIGEEATEVVLAARVQSDERLAEESADLLYHLLVALHQRGLPLARVMDVLRSRRK